MHIVRNAGSLILLVVLALVAVLPASASATADPTHQVVKESVSWTLDPGLCKQIGVVINGKGQRLQDTVTTTNEDGSTTATIADRVSGEAVDAKGATYQWLYLNFSTWVTPASGKPVAIDMSDLFMLQGEKSKRNDLYVTFDWRWTYDPTTSQYWPPVDNLYKTSTVGDPYNCDPI